MRLARITLNPPTLDRGPNSPQVGEGLLPSHEGVVGVELVLEARVSGEGDLLKSAEEPRDVQGALADLGLGVLRGLVLEVLEVKIEEALLALVHRLDGIRSRPRRVADVHAEPEALVAALQAPQRVLGRREEPVLGAV